MFLWWGKLVERLQQYMHTHTHTHTHAHIHTHTHTHTHKKTVWVSIKFTLNHVWIISRLLWVTASCELSVTELDLWACQFVVLVPFGEFILCVIRLSLWLIWTNRPEWRDKRRCFGLIREPVSVNGRQLLELVSSGRATSGQSDQWTEPPVDRATSGQSPQPLEE